MTAPDRPATEPARSTHAQPHRVAGWREHHAWSARASLGRLAARPIGTLLTIAVMGVALALPLAFWLLLGNLQRLGGALGQNDAISVFLQPGQGAAVAQLLATELRERNDVAVVTIKTPQQGMDELASLQGFSGALHALDDNPLPYVLVVQPKAELPADAIERLAADLRAMKSVDMVQDSGTWRQRLDALLGVGARVVLVLAAMLALAVLLVVGNTVRVDIASRAEEIGVLVLLGASRAFVRRPYLYAGIWYGLFAGILAALIAVAIEAVLAAPVEQLARAYNGAVSFSGLPFWLLGCVPLAAAALGWLGARVVSARQLRLAA